MYLRSTRATNQGLESESVSESCVICAPPHPLLDCPTLDILGLSVSNSFPGYGCISNALPSVWIVVMSYMSSSTKILLYAAGQICPQSRALGLGVGVEKS